MPDGPTLGNVPQLPRSNLGGTATDLGNAVARIVSGLSQRQKEEAEQAFNQARIDAESRRQEGVERGEDTRIHERTQDIERRGSEREATREQEVTDLDRSETESGLDRAALLRRAEITAGTSRRQEERVAENRAREAVETEVMLAIRTNPDASMRELTERLISSGQFSDVLSNSEIRSAVVRAALDTPADPVIEGLETRRSVDILGVGETAPELDTSLDEFSDEELEDIQRLRNEKVTQGMDFDLAEQLAKFEVRQARITAEEEAIGPVDPVEALRSTRRGRDF